MSSSRKASVNVLVGEARCQNHLRIRHEVERFVERHRDYWPYKNLTTFLCTAELAIAPVMLLLEGSIRHTDPQVSASQHLSSSADGGRPSHDGALPLFPLFASSISLLMSAIVGLYACRKREHSAAALPALMLFAAAAALAAVAVLFFTGPPVIGCLLFNAQKDTSCWTVHFVGAFAWTLESIIQCIWSVMIVAICINAIFIYLPSKKRKGSTDMVQHLKVTQNSDLCVDPAELPSRPETIVEQEEAQPDV